MLYAGVYASGCTYATNITEMVGTPLSLCTGMGNSIYSSHQSFQRPSDRSLTKPDLRYELCCILLQEVQAIL